MTIIIRVKRGIKINLLKRYLVGILRREAQENNYHNMVWQVKLRLDGEIEYFVRYRIPAHVQARCWVKGVQRG